MRAVERRPPTVMRALTLVALMDLVARTRGFGSALAFAKRLGAGEATSSDAQLTADTAKAVIMAAAFYPRRALCLEQSLALFVLLRRRGIGAELKVGMRALPFSAHAWVEVDGAPVNELQGHIEQLVTFQQVSV